MAWATLCELSELIDGQGKYVEIDGYRLALFLDDGVPFVIDDRCPHAGASLSAGSVERGCAICPWHAWAFQLADGKMPGTPGVAVRHYSSRVHTFNGKQFVQANLPTP